MTRESKVGLFVGLSIIILFAVVIADKGQARRVTPADFGTSLADGSRSTRAINGTDRAATEPDEGRLPVDRVLHGPENVVTMRPAPARTEPPRQEPPKHETPAPTSDLPELPPSALADASKSREMHALTVEPAAPDNSARSDGVIPVPDDGERGAPPRATLAANESREARAEREKLEALDRRLNGGQEPPRDEPSPKRESEVTPPEKTPDQPAVATRTHAVKSGESLAAIARKYYGRSSMQVVDAIFNANRGTLADRNSIRAGQSLVIPVMAKSTEMTDATPRSTMLKAAGTADLPKIPPTDDDEREPRTKPTSMAAAKKSPPASRKPAGPSVADARKRPRPAESRTPAREVAAANRKATTPSRKAGKPDTASAMRTSSASKNTKRVERNADAKRAPARRSVNAPARPSRPASKHAGERAAREAFASRDSHS